MQEKVFCLSFSFKNSFKSFSVRYKDSFGRPHLPNSLYIYTVLRDRPKHEDPPKPAIPFPKEIYARKKNRNQIIMNAIIPLIGIEFATYLLFKSSDPLNNTTNTANLLHKFYIWICH